MAWYDGRDSFYGLEELPRRPSGELSGIEAEVYKRRYSLDLTHEKGEDQVDASWHYGGTAGALKPDAEPPAPSSPTCATPALVAAEEKEPCRSAVTKSRSICVAVGDDVCTDKVLKYASKYICKPKDSVALVHMCKSSSASAASKDGQLLERAKAALLQSGKVAPEQVSVVLVPAAKHVGQSLVAHCKQSGYHILVIGCRGLSGMKKKLTSFMGEGSVSQYCSEQLRKRMAVVVIKAPAAQG